MTTETTAGAAVVPFDVQTVRARFPGLTSDWVFLDNAGGSQVLATAADRVREYLLSTSVQLGASYEPSRIAAERVAAGVAAAAALFGSEPGEVVLGPSSTQLLANLARSIGRTLEAGDEVVVTDCDHEANVTPWRRLEELGVRVLTWKTDLERLELRLEDLDPVLSPRTRLVCFPHVSNLLGTIHPVAAFTARIRAAGARSIVDGVAFAPHRRIDVGCLGADAYVFSVYKVFGPHLAAIAIDRPWLEVLPGINHAFVGREQIPYKLQPGGCCYELAASLPAIVEYLESLGQGATRKARINGAFAAIAEHEAVLAESLLSFLRERPSVRILGERTADPARRVATISFAVEGRLASEIPAALDRERVGIRFGDFHSRRLVEALGLADRQGVVRISMAHYNTAAEIERTIAALEAVL